MLNIGWAQMHESKQSILRNANLSWHVVGSFANMIGDQLTLLALPWLVLQVTGDPFKVGAVIGLSAFPRLLFLLIGGAVVDRFSPRQVLIVARIVNAILLGGFGLLVIGSKVPLLAIYTFSLLSGFVSAFYIPAVRSILRNIVVPDQLQAATSLLEGLRQGTACVAPLVGGILITMLGDGGVTGSGNTTGLGLAFTLNGLSFAFSTLTLLQIKWKSETRTSSSTTSTGVLKMVFDGIRYCWADDRLRTIFLYASLTHLCASGPVAVAIPLLAKNTGQSAQHLGLLMGALGAGSIVGIALAGIRPQWSAGRLGTTMLLSDGMIGGSFIIVSWAGSSWVVMALFVFIGVSVGYQQIVVGSWIQRYVQPLMIGRIFSLFMMQSIGLAPISGMVVGFAGRSVDVYEIFLAVGVLMLTIAAVAWLLSPMRVRLAGEGNSEAAKR